MRRPLTSICVNVRAAIYDSDQSIDMRVDLTRLDVGVLLHNHVGGLVPSLTGGLVPGHHAFESRAVLGVVHALRIAFVQLRPRVPRGLRAWTTPPRSAPFWRLRGGLGQVAVGRLLSASAILNHLRQP